MFHRTKFRRYCDMVPRICAHLILYTIYLYKHVSYFYIKNVMLLHYNTVNAVTPNQQNCRN